MIVKTHKTGDGRRIIAVCDKGLLGKKFEEKNLQLDLTSNFYKGEEKTEDEIIRIMKGSYMLNLVGKGSVDLALKEKLIDKKNIVYIKKIPHAQVILLD